MTSCLRLRVYSFALDCAGIRLISTCFDTIDVFLLGLRELRERSWDILPQPQDLRTRTIRCGAFDSLPLGVQQRAWEKGICLNDYWTGHTAIVAAQYPNADVLFRTSQSWAWRQPKEWVSLRARQAFMGDRRTQCVLTN